MQTLSLRISRYLWLAGVWASLHLPHYGQAAGLIARWGNNTSGQCQVPRGVVRVKAIAAGGTYSMALTLDGRVVSWGSNYYGEGNIPPNLSNVTAIAAGPYHSLALKADGTVVAWGYGAYGQTNVPLGLNTVVAIAAGSYHSLALEADGRVVAWGQATLEQVNVPAGLSNVVAIAAGNYHSLALKADGTLVAWGGGSSGQASIPPGLGRVTAIAAGSYHNLVLQEDGTVAAWGENYYGETNVPRGLSNVVAIAAGGEQSLALKADGRVVAWGYPGYGLTNVPPGLPNVTAIAAGGTHSLALVFEGPVQILQDPQSQSVVRGSNVTFSAMATGQEPLTYQWFCSGIPLTNASDRIAGATSPSLTISNLQFGDTGLYTLQVSNAFSLASSSGAVLTVIGPPILIAQPVSQKVKAGATVFLSGVAEGTAPLQYQWLFDGTNLAGASNYYLSLVNVQPSQSGTYSLVVTNAYGSVQSTGAVLTVTDSPPYFVRQPTNQLVPLGGTARLMADARGSSPLSYQWRFNGVDLPGATRSVLTLEHLGFEKTGYYNAVARNASGETVSSKALLSVVQAFVFSEYPYYSTPTNVPPGVSNLVAVAVGDSHVLALKNDGRIITWAGLSSYANVLTNIPASASNVTAVAAGGNCSMVLRANGTVVAWGDAYSRQTSVPAGLSNVMAISVGGTHCLALMTNGTVVVWGSSSLLTNVPAGLSNVIAVSAGSSHNLALKADGTVAAWGSSSLLTNVPAGLSNVIAISAGVSHNLALKADGTVAAWGSNSLLTNVPAGLANVVAVEAGFNRSLALKADGSVVSWGNQKTNALSGLSNVIAIAASWGRTEQSGYVVTLMGNGAPAWTLQPVSQPVRAGAAVQLHGRAVGVQPISYQWLRNGVELPGGTTASLTLPNFQRTNSGGYRLVATNALGQITSAPATLAMPYNGTLAAALNATNLVWTGSTTNLPWFPQIQESHDGEAAAQSGPIKDNQQSILQTTVTGPGTLSFWWKVSSEAGFDFLKLYLDRALSPLASISGETGWEQRTFAIPSGTHTLQWVYAKDASVSDGQDAGWVDEVSFTVPAPVIMIQPMNQTRNLGGSASFGVGVSGMGPMTFQWSRSGCELAGATRSSLVLTNLTRRDAGNYAVAVRNPGGTVLSSNALLVVRVPQLLSAARMLPDGSFEFASSDADNGGLLPGDVAAFEVQASTNLLDWAPVSHTLTLTNGTLLLHDSSTNYPRRFYRILEHKP